MVTDGVPVDLLQDGLVRFEPPGTQSTTSDAPPSQATPVGMPCTRCHERPAAHRCYQCERWVCKDDHWIMLGLCKDCATTADNRSARDPAARAPPDLGIKWIAD